MFCDITMPDGDPLFADPREVLRRQLNAARNMGFEFAASPEIEFYVVKPDAPGEGDQPPTPADKGGYFDQAKRNEASKLRRQAVSALSSYRFRRTVTTAACGYPVFPPGGLMDRMFGRYHLRL